MPNVDLDPNAEGNRYTQVKQLFKWAKAIAYRTCGTANGKYLIIGRDTVVEIWNGPHTEKFQSIPVATSAVAVSADGHFMAVAALDKTISIWTLR